MNGDAAVERSNADSRGGADCKRPRLLSSESSRTHAFARAHACAGASHATNSSLGPGPVTYQLSLRAFDFFLRIAHRDIDLPLRLALCLAHFLCDPRALDANSCRFSGCGCTIRIVYLVNFHFLHVNRFFTLQ